LVFLGPVGLQAALPRGGQFIDLFPADPTNHMEGLILQRWKTHKAPGSTLTSETDVTHFVCLTFKILLEIMQSNTPADI
jgi:hypothetical protein